MAINCIPKEEIIKLKKGILRGDFNIAKMYDMTSVQRRAIFAKYLSKDMARFINKEFEKAMVSNRQDALKEWAERTFKGNKEKKKDIIDKIDDLEEAGLLNVKRQEEFMEDLIAEKLGVGVTPEEIKIIKQYTDKLKELNVETQDLTIDPVNNTAKWTEYLKTRDELNKYIQSLTPTSPISIATSILGRSFMLASIKSPVVNITANTVMGTVGSITRRNELLGKRQPTAIGHNADYAKDYIKTVWDIWQKANFDISRMDDINDTIKIRGENILHAEGPGKFRKFSRFTSNVVFKHAMGDPDVFASAANFADYAMLNSTLIARQEGLKGKAGQERALEIFKDATLISPQTLEGQQLRQGAKNDAEYFTFTNSAFLSKISLGSREFINKATGKLRLGDALIPFAKVPANAIQASIDSSGILAVKDMYDVVQGIKTGDKTRTDKGIRGLYLAGLGVLGGWLLVQALDPEDYIGDYASYSQAERKLIEAKNGTYRSIRIGNKWISLDYLGPLMSPMVGMLEARRTDNPTEKAKKYFTGVARQAVSIPGLEELYSLLQNVEEAQKEDKGLDYVVDEAKEGFLDFVVSRFIPAIISDVAQAIDTSRREARTFKTKLKRKIPFVSKQLEPKINIFGEIIETENPFNTLMFGSRLKTYEGSDVLNELNRLESQGQLPSISDIKFTSSRVKKLQAQIGKEEFTEFIIDFGKEYFKALDKNMKMSKYDQLDDEKKKKLINDIKSDVLDETLKKHGFKK